MEEKKVTVGSKALELMGKEPEQATAIDYEREMHKDYEKNIFECIDRGKHAFDGDFFVVVETKKERLMQNVIRNYFFPRQSCPTPAYDQTVYKYHRSDEVLEFLWVVPSKDTVQLFKDNALEISPAEKDLLYFVLDFEDGTLLKKAQTLNGEPCIRI